MMTDRLKQITLGVLAGLLLGCAVQPFVGDDIPTPRSVVAVQ